MGKTTDLATRQTWSHNVVSSTPHLSVIGTDLIGSSNYHTITTTTAPILIRDCIGGVMVKCARFECGRYGFEPRPGQITTIKLVFIASALSTEQDQHQWCNSKRAVDCGFEPWPGQTKENTIGRCDFSTEHAALRSKSKDWLAWNLDMCKWSNMSTCRLVLVR